MRLQARLCRERRLCRGGHRRQVPVQAALYSSLAHAANGPGLTAAGGPGLGWWLHAAGKQVGTLARQPVMCGGLVLGLP